MNFDAAQYSIGFWKCLIMIDLQLIKLKQHETASKETENQGTHQFKGQLAALKVHSKNIKFTKFDHKAFAIFKIFQNLLVNINFKIVYNYSEATKVVF